MKIISFFICLILCSFSFKIIRTNSKYKVQSNDSVKPIFIKTLELTGRPINSLVFFNSNFYYSSRDGVFKIDIKNKKAIPIDGGLDVKLPNSKVFTKLVIHKSQLYAANLFKGIYRLNEKNNQWVSLTKGIKDSTFFDLVSCNGKLYAPAHDDGLFVLNNGDDSWSPVKGDKAKYLKMCGCFDSILWLGNASTELYRLNPKTNELKKIVQFKKPEMYGKSIMSLGISGLLNVNDTIYAGCHVSGMFKSTDNGLTWSKKPIKFVVGVLYKWQNYVFLSDYWGYKDGLFILNTVTDEFQRIDLGLKDQKIHYIQCINGIFYITNNDGIWEISIDDFVKYYLPSP